MGRYHFLKARRGWVLGLGLFALLPNLGAQESSSREEDLEAIRGEIASLQSQLQRVQISQQGISGELEKTRLELELQGQKVAEAVAARALTEERIEALEARVAELEEAVEVVRHDLERQLVSLYRVGRGGHLRALLAMDSGEHLLSAIRMLRYLTKRDQEALDRYVTAQVRLSLEEEELQTEGRRAAAWLQEEEDRRRQLAALERRQANILAELERERLDLQSQTHRLVEKERKLAHFLDFLYGQESSPLAGRPIQSFKGVLDWPVQGQVVERFGPRKDPRYSTLVPHNGIELGTRTGDPVKTVFPGRVLFAAPFQGYGDTVVVHHAGRVFTLYAGLGRVSVARGDVLSLDQEVGVAKDRLYFEIRLENQPEDPLSWLR